MLRLCNRVVVAALVMSGLFLQTACLSPAGETVDAQRASAMKMHDRVLAQTTKRFPELQGQIDQAAGYAVFDTGVIKILIVGTASGYGVVVDQKAGTRTIVDDFVIALGPGIELSNTVGVAVLHTPEAVEAGEWDFGADASIGFQIGSFGGDTSAIAMHEGSTMYRDMNNGIQLHASVFWAKIAEDEELN
jgi:hypothetical protein